MRIMEQQGTWSDYSHIFIQKLITILVSQVAAVSQAHNSVKYWGANICVYQIFIQPFRSICGAVKKKA